MDIRRKSLPEMVESAMAHNKLTRDDDFLLWGVVHDMFYPAFERPIKTYTEMSMLMSHLSTLDHVARARRTVWKKYDYTRYLPNSIFIAERRNIPPEKYEAFQKANPDSMEKEFANLAERNIYGYTAKDWAKRDKEESQGD